MIYTADGRGNRRQLLVGEDATDQRADVLVKWTASAAIVDEQKTARLQVMPQRVDCIVAELRIAVARHVEERIRRDLRFDRVDVFHVELHGQTRLGGDVTEELGN